MSVISHRYHLSLFDDERCFYIMVKINCTAEPKTFSPSALTLAQEENLAAQAKALAHPARVRILSVLLTLDNQNSCLNSDLVAELGLAQSTISEHLRILKQAQFIHAEPKPPKVCYRINQEELINFKQLYSTLFT